MSELPYFVQCILALLEQVPSFLDLIVRHAISIVSRKTETLSYKSNIRLDRDEEDMIRFEHTHESLIDSETWDACIRGP